MATLSQHKSKDVTKLLLIGDAKSGKTGSLVSLVQAGYKLRVLDYDNLLDSLKYQIIQHCPDKLDNVEFRTLRDQRVPGPTGPVIKKPTAFPDGVKMLDHWKYTEDDGTVVDLGSPSDWGPDCVLVIDSLSRFCDAAYDFREPLTPRSSDGKFDGRAVYGDAQDAVESILAMVTAESFNTNVIVIAHIQYMDLPSGEKKGFPQGVGQKLSPKIPQYFPSVVLYTNKGGKRTLQTNSTPLIDLANPAPFAMEPSYPIETGLADFFKVLRDPKVKAQVAPKAVPTLKRA